MKKIIMFAVLAVAMVFMTSCAKEEGKKVDVEKVVKAPVEAAKPALEPKADVKEQSPDVVKAPPEPAKVPEAVKSEEAKPAEPEKKVEPVKRADVNVAEIPADPNMTYKIGWSRYIGWEIWGYIWASGIMDKWAAKYGVKIVVDFYSDYGESMSAFNTQDDLVGLTITNMDALLALSLSGTDVEADIIGDYSNDNDQVLAYAEVTTFADMVTHKIIIQRGTVSEFLLYRCLGKYAPEVKFGDLQLSHTGEAEMVTTFASDTALVAVTWNPHAMNILQQVSGAHKLCGSSDFPGEILDMLVFKPGTPTAVKKAAVGAWYEANAELSAKDPAVRGKVLDFIAQQTSFTVPAIESQLKTTFMYYTPEDALAYTMSDQLPKTMEYVRTFCFDNKMFPAEAQTKDEVGIAFPDGSIQGNKDKVRLTFNPAYMQLAADGKL